uniref:Hematopoietic lineage cell-specific protein n=1 Tax=Callorhinchus milii TaxID=7868 RepID=A0A4W3GGU9_CALMI
CGSETVRLTLLGNVCVTEDEGNIYDIADAGVTATALYDYQGEGDDEISFDPNEVITNIEMVDEGWWRGQCQGRVGLFPANYVRLNQ